MEEIQGGIDALEEKYLFQKIFTNAINSAKPFIIGPATLDSLVEREPETYEYVENAQLPFPTVFFEFPEPYTLALPFLDKESEIVGICFGKPNVSAVFDIPEKYQEEFKQLYDSPIYVASLYFSNGKTTRFNMTFNPKKKDLFVGGEVDNIHFTINAKEKTVKVIKKEDLVDTENFLDSTYNPSITAFDDIKNKDSFFKIANLCTNIVNYINAHNVTYVKKNRTIESVVRNERGKKKKITSVKPYYIIEVKDRICEDSDSPTGKTWDLQWRVYVIGHDRRYRNEEGEIYKTIWISPYVKGPPDAPWKENRYAVDAEKLEREKKLIQKMS